MTWESVGALGEIIGAIAVVITLVVLIVQIKANTRAIEAQSVRELLSQFSQSWYEFAGNPYLPEVMAKYQRGEPLTDVESQRLRAHAHGALYNMQIEHYQLKLGTLDSGFGAASEVLLQEILRPGRPFREVWDENKQHFTQDFQKFVEAQINNDRE